MNNKPQMTEKYTRCTFCLMDTTDPDICFDLEGRCNHCRDLELKITRLPFNRVGNSEFLLEKINQIKQNGKGKDYDCLIGLSGGVDSSYVALLVKEFGLRPLAVHLDNGWNSDQATRNIHNIVEILKLDLFTFVIDWEEFCDLQRSFFVAGVVDIELLTDHAISTCMMRLAREHGVSWMISGANVTTEGIMPLSWSHSKWDSWNIKSIQRRFGTKRIKTFPLASNLEIIRSLFKSGYQRLDILNYVKFDRNIAIKRLTEELSWVPYGEKHYESVFTKFYQAYVLPIRFGADKRLAHLSALVVSGNMQREDAIEQLSKPIYPEEELRIEKAFVMKKLRFEEHEFDNLMKLPGVPHSQYASVHDIAKYLGPLTRRLKKVRYSDVQDANENGAK